MTLCFSFVQISNAKNYYVKVHVDDSWHHIKIHKDFNEKLTLQDVQQDKAEADPVNYF